MKSFAMVMMCVFAFLVFTAGAAPKKIIVPKDFRTIQKAIDEVNKS